MAADSTILVTGVLKDATGTALSSATVEAVRLQSSAVASSLVDGTQYTADRFSTTTNASGVFTITITHALAPTCPLTYRVNLPDKRYFLLNVGVNDGGRTINVGTLLTASGPAIGSDINITTLVNKNIREGDGYAVGAPSDATVTGYVAQNGAFRTLYLTLTATPVTLTKNGTSSGGGGIKIWDFEEGLILPLGATSNLTVAGAGNASFLASLGSVVADTGGTLTSTEANVAPSTAATTSGGGHTGTCKMKSTVSVPTPGSPLDGTATAIDLYLNSALNADATGIEALTFSGTIVIPYLHCGDN